MPKKYFLLVLCVLINFSYLHSEGELFVQSRYLPSKLQSPSKFHLNQFSEEELASGWFTEYQLGLALLENQEMTLALQSLKRAEALIPTQYSVEKNQILYAKLYIYYLCSQFKQLIVEFEKSDLLYAPESFSAYHDLLFMLYESYERVGEPKKSDALIKKIQKCFPGEVDELRISQALIRQDMNFLQNFSFQNPKRGYLKSLAKSYQNKMKSPTLAKWLGIICPGAGYLYAGQYKSATTSFLINGLLIAASTQLFLSQLYTLGVVVATFEAGWYIGGILGGKEAVKGYNQHLYQDFESRVIFQESGKLEGKVQYEI